MKFIVNAESDVLTKHHRTLEDYEKDEKAALDKAKIMFEDAMKKSKGKICSNIEVKLVQPSIFKGSN